MCERESVCESEGEISVCERECVGVSVCVRECVRVAWGQKT